LALFHADLAFSTFFFQQSHTPSSMCLGLRFCLSTCEGGVWLEHLLCVFAVVVASFQFQCRPKTLQDPFNIASQPLHHPQWPAGAWGALLQARCQGQIHGSLPWGLSRGEGWLWLELLEMLVGRAWRV
jgi:hypothetical protein